MPDRTVYTLSEKGKEEFVNTLKASILQFSYDTKAAISTHNTNL